MCYFCTLSKNHFWPWTNQASLDQIYYEILVGILFKLLFKVFFFLG